MDLIIMRHGERDEKKGVRERDQCLTPNGKNKARKTADSIHKVLGTAPSATVMSSPYRPAIETAQIVCEQLGLKALRLDNDLAPDQKLSDVIELLRSPLQKPAVIIVGHNPQLEDLAKQLSSKIVTIERGDCCRLEVNSLDQGDATVCEMPPGDPSDAPKPSYWKTIGGMFFAGLAFITLLVGGLVLSMGIKAILAGAGEEGITTIVLKGYGKVKDVISGTAMILTPIGYIRKAYQEAIKDERRGIIYTIRHMWPF